MSESAPPACPRCQRRVAAARATCIYCGAPLPAAAAPPEPEPEAPLLPATRALLILDVEASGPERLAAALGLTVLETRLWATQAPFRLQRLGPPQDVEAEAGRLQDAGLTVAVLPEAEVRPALTPRLARGGRPQPDGLELDLGGAARRLGPGELLLVVEGPIAREYQTQQDLRRVRAASLAPGYRLHLHLRGEARPLELDPGGFDFGGPRGIPSSSMLELRAWLAPLRAGVPTDSSFERLLPALGPAGPGQGGALSAAEALRAQIPAEGQALVLDNLAQFRFFSAWRGLLERRRRG
jgi:hypothetical protein